MFRCEIGELVCNYGWRVCISVDGRVSFACFFLLPQTYYPLGRFTEIAEGLRLTLHFWLFLAFLAFPSFEQSSHLRAT